jgi:hypothetical protein
MSLEKNSRKIKTTVSSNDDIFKEGKKHLGRDFKEIWESLNGTLIEFSAIKEDQTLYLATQKDVDDLLNNFD